MPWIEALSLRNENARKGQAPSKEGATGPKVDLTPRKMAASFHRAVCPTSTSLQIRALLLGPVVFTYIS